MLTRTVLDDAIKPTAQTRETPKKKPKPTEPTTNEPKPVVPPASPSIGKKDQKRIQTLIERLSDDAVKDKLQPKHMSFVKELLDALD